MANNQGTVGAVLFFIGYLTPMIVAYARGHKNTLAISVLNLLTGWTVIGWLVALVWSCTAVEKSVGRNNTEKG